jgi:AraC family transcriptional regulator
MDWITGLNRLLSYIEGHLTDSELTVEAAARYAAYSPFYLQRIFYGLTDMPLSEYIRSRRMSLAGQELQTRGAKVIDVALKYGYETPESFQKAFQRFHGITPRAAKRPHAKLMFMSPLQMNVSLKGGNKMDYTIETKGPMTVIGFERRFAFDKGIQDIPKFWEEFFGQGLMQRVNPLLGCCFDDGSKEDFPYLIGDFCAEDAPVPEGMVKRTVPAFTWALFHTEGNQGKDIQTLNRQIYAEWLPANPQYEMADGMNIEVYPCSCTDWEDKRWGIWVPIREK